MPVVAPSGNGTNPSVPRNNGGTAIYAGGRSSDSKITRSLDPINLADDFHLDIGSRVVAKNGTGANTTDRVGISGIRPTAALGYTPSATEWIMQGVTTTLAGITNLSLFNTSADYDGSNYDNIHQLLSTRRFGSGINTTYNFLARPNGTINPNFTKGTGAGVLQNYAAPSGNGTGNATDDAATPTRAVPGELTYRFGGSTPFRATYKAKDSFES
jgi:hypothetical protein